MTGAEAPINAVAAGVAGPVSGDLQENPGPGALPSEDGQPCWADGYVETFVLFCKALGEGGADSRDVAAYFGKRHDNVLQDIDNLLKELGEGGLSNFGETPYVDPQNGQTYRRYEMTRDGFTLLAVGSAPLRNFAPSDGAVNRLKPSEKTILSLTEGRAGKRRGSPHSRSK